jgi:hypothetical protein
VGDDDKLWMERLLPFRWEAMRKGDTVIGCEVRDQEFNIPYMR